MRVSLDPPNVYLNIADDFADELELLPVTWELTHDGTLNGYCGTQLVMSVYRIAGDKSLGELVDQLADIGSPDNVGWLISRIAAVEHRLQIAYKRIVELEGERAQS